MNAELVGTLNAPQPRNLVLTYSDRWCAASQPTPLSVSLPVRAQPHAGEVVSNYLWGLFPDNPAVIQRWAREAQCSASNLIGLLATYGSDVAGAAQYVPAGQTGEEDEAGGLSPVTDAQIAGFLRQASAESTIWRLAEQGRWSLAGAQAKIALHRDRDTGAWSAPHGSIPTTHILKPAIAGLRGHDLNEHLCMSAARTLGLPTATTEIGRFDGLTALIVQRFDRLGELESYRRVHQEDFCQALGMHPDQKYQNEGGPSVEDMLELLARVSSQPREDAATLLRALAYNWLTLGTDAHAKNYSLLLAGTQVRLAPLYDLASSAPYGRHPKKLRLAQKIDGHYGPAEVSRHNWERLATAAGLDPASFVDELSRLAAELPQAFEHATHGSNLTETEQQLAAQMTTPILAWTQHCLLALHR